MKLTFFDKTKTFSIHQVKLKALGMYIFSIILIYLAGSYFGGILLFLYYSFILLPVFSLILLFFVIRGIKFFQYFSTDHPVKGETIEYRVVLSNESLFPVSEISSKFMTINPLMPDMIPNFRLSLGQGKTKEFTYRISCSYRGIYQVGLNSLHITDIMGLVTINLPVWHRTFYVYPRIIAIYRFSFGIEGFLNKGEDKATTGLSDNTLIKGIQEYKKSEPVRHMYWKKFAATGRPVLKEYDTSTTPEVTIYIDLFHTYEEERSIKTLEREDVTVEICTALAKYFLYKNTGVTIRCPCNPLFSFKGNRQEHFEEYYKQTTNIFSGQNENPVDLFRVDLKNGTLESKSIIFITHRIDTELFNVLEESITSDMQIMVIFNHSTTEEQVQKKNKRFFHTLQDKGAMIIDVQSSHTIAEDMERYGS
ncbi:MAG: DUF58 domain-containing protein [Spirochaetales bacterium]|nr:DUF58 domain-containing protein [Spirochaetales bacterium]